jgi:hypothetical protein
MQIFPRVTAARNGHAVPGSGMAGNAVLGLRSPSILIAKVQRV